MHEVSESTKTIVIIVVGIISLLMPLTFILMWGPHRFEKKEKH